MCSLCPHGKLKQICKACKTTRAEPSSSKRIKREPESSPRIKIESEIKLAPDVKPDPEPFTIRGYFGISGEDGR
tara:strand:+ start:173 stop:394 length:222 start_codon:yes stop_codon:yes gene_type:complete